MPIRYCTATSKRTKKPCRARAMVGRTNCYHHGGKSLRGLIHPNFKHGYYSTNWFVKFMWTQAQNSYRRAMQQERNEQVMAELRETMPTETNAQWKRYRAAVLARVRHMPENSIPAEFAQEVWDTVIG